MPGLSKRPALIVANKMDLEPGAENLTLLREELSHIPLEIIPVSAESGDVEAFKTALRHLLEANQANEFNF